MHDFNLSSPPQYKKRPAKYIIVDFASSPSKIRSCMLPLLHFDKPKQMTLSNSDTTFPN